MLIKKYKRLTKILNNQHDQSHIMFSHHKKQLLEEPYLRLGSTSYSFITVLGVMSMLLLLLPLRCIDAVGYSYTRFVGPVAGPEHKIYVHDANVAANGKTHHHGGVPRLDYVAKAEYNFAYGVEDADAHILHNRNEMRDGDAVKGVYSLIDPDGALRVVKYTADDINGFQAEVIRNGVSSLHGQLQHDYKRAPPSEIINNYYKPDREQYHYPQSQTHLKADTSHKYYPSSNIYSPNLEQLPQINHEQYNPHKHYQPPPQPPIIYHFNNNNDDDDNDDDSGSDYRDEPKPQYEVHEKPNNYYNDKQEDDDVHYDENGHGHKSNNDDNVVDYKKKKQHPKEEDDDDDDDYDDEDESEELEEYDETVHNAHNSNESDEYY
ncbi:Cuticle protein 8 [Lucilia cuprina]|nr:Cuticle protein 8 [Lucilia cuprina]